MQHYIFTTKDIRNTLIKSATDDTIKFTVSTTSVEENNFKPKTEIRRMSEKAPLAVVIHWDDRIFEIEGRKLSFTTTKVHPSVLFSPTTERIWRWDGEAYLVDYRRGKWEVKTELGKKHAAAFTIQYSPLFRAEQPASMKIESFAEQDTLFFILMFIYSEFKRRDELESDSDSE
ncbi:hypothetical protein PC9H_008229 [Pleurotus ostreatus]|uniref:Uncharacterized protein n=1 Tax=Pleurotus ostreatus TaxID=5322 RepID=A0A8H6ZV16_PLEOS|nr:uncharacterized protein PC9H_008229 [Pleurotus ostreatus]KAF7428991.1 hypothetical protein PC9H_008229 [Pleurotus ostreatus]KAJ8697270.1 hypothetical protein PTI98_007065 [Pleurotus ostreatus]